MKVLGKKTAFTFLAAISLSSIAFGYLLDFLFVTYDLPLMHNHEAMNHNHELIAPELKLILGIIFLILLLSSLYRKYGKRLFKQNDTKQVNRPLETGIKKINISGMTCNHCVTNVRNTISSISGIESVEVRLDENAAYVKGNYDENKLRAEIESIGYKVV
jgi:copper chaperone CopZ